MNVIKSCYGVLLLCLLVSCGKKDAQQKQEAAPEEYPILVLHKQNATLENVFPATIRGQEDIAIQPRIDGFIDAIYVDEGSVVKKGQLLFKINSPSAEQSYRSAQAAVVSSQATLNSAQLDVDRIRPLAEKGIISEVQLQNYENTHQSAQAAVAQAEATLANARATYAWTNVTSPVDGIVGSIPYRQGSLVSSANTLTTVANISNIFAYFSMNEKDLLHFLGNLPGRNQAEKIRNIPPVTLVLADGTDYEAKGRVETIAGVIDVNTGSTNFRAEFPNPKGILRSGSSGKIIIPQTLENVLVIPQKATFAQQDKVLAYKVQGDSVSQKVITAISSPDGKEYYVTEGLAEGDSIVADGVATLSNGKKIKVN